MYLPSLTISLSRKFDWQTILKVRKSPRPIALLTYPPKNDPNVCLILPYLLKGRIRQMFRSFHLFGNFKNWSTASSPQFLRAHIGISCLSSSYENHYLRLYVTMYVMFVFLWFKSIRLFKVSFFFPHISRLFQGSHLAPCFGIHWLHPLRQSIFHDVINNFYFEVQIRQRKAIYCNQIDR